MAQRTALYDRHVALGGRMIAYAGWELPVQYSDGPKAEHHAVRRAVGLFDIDHMGQVVVSGPDALPFLQGLLTADVSAFEVGRAHYSLMCYDDGGVVDDVFVYRLPERYFIAVNAANNVKDTHWLNYHRGDHQVHIDNVSDATYMLALQGPRAQDCLQPLTPAKLGDLAFHRCLETEVAGVPALLGRTGYTGEDGFELYFPTTDAVRVWDALMEAGRGHGLTPAGLAARDALRFEACLPLYGQEISALIDPIEAGLGWAVALDKGAFVGREALLKTRLEGAPNRLVGLEMTEGGVPRHGYEVLIDGVACGEVTSGMYAPTLDRFLALAYVPAEHSAVGTEVEVAIRDRPRSAVIVKRPFYTPAYRRKKARL